MSARTPFRSHLLQQWTQQTSRRPPAAIVPWLRPSAEAPNSTQSSVNSRPSSRSSSSDPPKQSPLRSLPIEDEFDTPHNALLVPKTNYHAKEASNAIHRKPNNLSSFASIDTTPSSAPSHFVNAERSWTKSTFKSPKRKQYQSFQSMSYLSAPLSSVRYSSQSYDEEGHHEIEENYADNIDRSRLPNHQDIVNAMHSLLMSRRTGTKFVHTSKNIDNASSTQEDEVNSIIAAIDRAVQTAQMAPNHKRTEPFSFIRFFSSSETATKLADISYQVTLNKPGSNEPVARKKREKWSNIPAFLVCLVHNNQDPMTSEALSSQTDTSEDDEDTVDPFQPVEYKPPTNERQLEDYASACAAVQNVLLSLHSEGIATKWATGPVIKTMAFRKLAQAQPTDRVAALIMIGGLHSTELSNEREEYLTGIRRQRRRPIKGDLLIDLL